MKTVGLMHEKKIHRETIVRQICPISQKINAVYIDEDDGTLTRSPVHAIVWSEIINTNILTEEIISRESDFRYLDFRCNGIFFLENTCPNLLGYEIEGQNYDWADDIKIYLAGKE